MKINIDPHKLIDIAKKYGTPCYLYSKAKIIESYSCYKTAFEHYNVNHLICYAVKASSNLAILNILNKLGSGFDIVSLGELRRVQKVNHDCSKVVFSGVGKQDFEIKAALEAGILCFNVESEAELFLINTIAEQLHKKAPISFRINPNIDAKSHPYISTGLTEHKFGIDIKRADYYYNLATNLKNINIIGMDCHIGSQITDTKPLAAACVAIQNLFNHLKNNNINISHINMGGGLGVNYEINDFLAERKSSNEMPDQKVWVDTIMQNLSVDPKTTVIIEPGRSIIAKAGILLTKVIYNKSNALDQHSFTIIDAGMNDLLRPALYHSKHKIINLSNNFNLDNFNNLSPNTSIVGPVCESSDTFTKNSDLSTKPDDILAILDTGAYGFVMSSNYNSRPRAAEVLLDENNHDFLIKPRETVEELYSDETIIH